MQTMWAIRMLKRINLVSCHNKAMSLLWMYADYRLISYDTGFKNVSVNITKNTACKAKFDGNIKMKTNRRVMTMSMNADIDIK